MINERPDVVIWHGGCLDGHAAAWAVHQKFPTAEFVPAQYGDAYPDVEGKRVLIVDFSYPEAVMRAICADALSVTVLDHHKSAQDHLEKLAKERLIDLTFDLERSGAGLTWAAIWGNRQPTLIDVVEDRDLWRFNLPYTKALTAALASYPLDFKVWDGLAREMEGYNRSLLIREGEAIIRARDKDIRQLLEATTRPMEIAGFEVPSANVPHFWASEAGNLMAPGKPFAVTWFENDAGERCFSLRSTPEGEDVSEIAKAFGGGGHRNAAGFKLTDVVEVADTVPEEVIPLNPGTGKVKVDAT